MSRHAGGESPLVFMSFDPSAADVRQTEFRATQIDVFMDREVGPYYTSPEAQGGLGLRYIDEDPYTIGDRARLLIESGPLQTAGKEYILAFDALEAGASDDVTALRGLAVLTKPDGLCKASSHAPTEIAEFDIAKELRGRGLGTLMMSKVIQQIDHNERIVLDVARPSARAQGFYLARSFQFIPDAPPVRHGVYDVEHIKMASTTQDIADTLRSHP